jgi:hypothetical protein
VKIVLNGGRVDANWAAFKPLHWNGKP